MNRSLIAVAILWPTLATAAPVVRKSFYNEKEPFAASAQLKQQFEFQKAHPNLGGAKVVTGTKNLFTFDVTQKGLEPVSPDIGRESTLGSNGINPHFRSSWNVKVAYEDKANYFGGAAKISLRSTASHGTSYDTSNYDVDLHRTADGKYVGEFEIAGHGMSSNFPSVSPGYLSFAFGGKTGEQYKWDSNLSKNYRVWSNDYADAAHRWVVGP